MPTIDKLGESNLNFGNEQFKYISQKQKQGIKLLSDDKLAMIAGVDPVDIDLDVDFM